MSTQKITSSKRKLDSYAATNELDKAAKALAAREGIPMVEALARLMKEQR